MDNTQFVKETPLTHNWWMEIDYMLLLPLFMMFLEKIYEYDHYSLSIRNVGFND